MCYLYRYLGTLPINNVFQIIKNASIKQFKFLNVDYLSKPKINLCVITAMTTLCVTCNNDFQKMLPN